ncbi:helix-turn-helix transcriptional regulator [Streptomyces sp. TRM68367]|uniref:ArsR/SmtB family transcription factor n=1 Tax=Streptomyces sp. TRM68367 TaxID=2758415 RepID=UPI00165CD84B|nr:winged helix-turn-helix domain-containing protein [Streptomyces sp. TRM68367]MBC9727077.1 helix-turn-helix domain-containing protein [Streptomyces sp. TRM68367]
MIRIHFTAQDLTRIRLRPTLGPIAETVFALGMLGHNGSRSQARWRNQLSRHLRHPTPLAQLLTAAQRRVQAPDDLLCLIDRSPGADDAALRSAGLSRRDAAAEITQVWRSALEPYAHRMHTRLTTECDARGRITMTGGVDGLFSTLHPRIRWNSPVMEIPGPSSEVFLDGQGLLLVPSLFLPQSRPGVLIGAEPETGQRALVFAAPSEAPADAGLWDTPDTSPQALSALVGRTRAAALRALTSSCTTSQLADLLGISSAGASQHTAVLRESGLITTMRNRNTVVHTVTPLGMALLGVPSPAERSAPPASQETRRAVPAM